MLEYLSKKIAGLNGSNFVKKRAQKRCFPANIAKFIKTPILKNIFERMFLALRKYVVNDILQLPYEKPSTGIHNASMKIKNSCQVLEKIIRNEAVGIGSF